MVCDNDFSLGPGADCRVLDFTVLFSNVFLVLVPAIIILVLAPLRLKRLAQKERKIRPWAHLPLRGKALLTTRVAAALVGIGAAVGSCAVTSGAWSDRASTIMEVVAMTAILLVVTLEHLRSLRPSQGPTLYLLVTTLFLASRTRTAALAGLSTLPLLSLSLASRFALFILLQLSARTSLIEPDVPPGATSGLVSRYLIAWVVPLLWRGFRTPLTMRDLGEIDVSLHTTSTWAAFEPRWRARSSSQPLLRALLLAFRAKLAAPLLPALIYSVTSMGRPLLISRTVLFVQSYATPQPQLLADGWGLVGAAALVYLVYALAYALAHVAIQRSALAVRGALMEALYRKTLVIRVDAAVEMGAAKASNLMSVDVENIVREIGAVHDVWTALVLTALGLYIIYTQIGISFLAGVIGAIIFFAVLPLVTRHIGTTRTGWADATDRRVKFTASVLRHIKAIKLSAYEPRIAQIACKMRSDEVDALVKWVVEILKVAVLTNWLSQFLALLTVVTYTLVSLYSNGPGGVTTARIFTVVATIELISFPLLMLGQRLGGLVTAWASLKRIEEFLLMDERREGEAAEGEMVPVGHHVRMSAASFGVKDKVTLLHDIEVDLHNPGVWMVTGRVGCGKSSLLQALIDELDLLSPGPVSVSLGAVGFCAQDPWLRVNGSVRDNITFVRPYEAAWYDRVIEALALDVDIKMFSDGDKTLVSGLSGGQKQRVALARAVYAQPDSLVLDDVFSALDAETEAHVYNALLGPSGLLRGKTVVLATNQIHRLPHADYITILQHGRVAEQGTYSDLSNQGGMLQMLISEFAAGAHRPASDKAHPDALSERAERDPEPTDTRILDRASIPDFSSNAPSSADADATAEMSRTGTVPRAVYGVYLRAMGLVSAGFWVAAIVLAAVVQLTIGIYLQAWTGALGSEGGATAGRYGQFLGGYSGMTIGYLVVFVAGIFNAFVYTHPIASRRMHEWMVYGVLRTSLDFFESTPIGQMVNRFNSDLNMIDMVLPNHAVNVMFTGTTVLGSAILITVAGPYMAAVVAAVAIAMVLLQRFYVRAGRELRRLDMTSRSPIFTLFSETIDPDGLRTIRAMRAGDRCVRMMTRRATDSQYPSWLLMAVQKWLELSLNMSVAIVNTLLVLVAVLNRNSTSAGLLAVAMTQAATLNQTIGVLVMEWTNVEMCITSVERMYEYITLPPQRDSGDAFDTKDGAPGPDDKGKGAAGYPPGKDDFAEDDAESSRPAPIGSSIHTVKRRDRSKPDWSAPGSITLHNVFARYAPTLPPALSGVSLRIRPGQRVGVCGRSGSGKSTLLGVLWRLIEYDDELGEVCVGGKEIGGMGLRALRSGMSIIPQDPLLLELTLRENVDIEGKHTDVEIWDALERAQLKSHVLTLPSHLSTPLTPSSLSRGQRQLLALARAILRARPILALDEATSSVDAATDAAVQQTIRAAFAGTTVLTVAHRIGTIMDYDVVVVMDSGRVVEVGEPGVLIKRRGGRFWALAKESGLVSELEHAQEEEGGRGGAGGLGRVEEDEIESAV